MEEAINLKMIMNIFKKRIVVIIAIPIITLILSAIYTFFLTTPQYEASTQILVNQNQQSDQVITSSELQSNRELINTYNVIMTSPIILEEVIEQNPTTNTVSELQEKISVDSQEDSQVVTLTVQDANPNTASSLANSIAGIFEQEVTNIMNIDNVSILSKAQESNNMTPVSPQPFLNLLIAFVIGVMGGIGLAFLLDFLDQTVKTEQDVENMLDLPILGSISVIDQNTNDYSQGSKSVANRYSKSSKNNQKKTRKTS